MEPMGPSKRQILRVALAALAVSAALAGCKTGSKSATAPTPSQSYPVRGVVQSVDPAAHEISLKHEAIPGLMEAMTMDYKVVDPAALGELHRGDAISATLLADHDAAGPLNMRLQDIVVVGQAKADYVPAIQYHVPQPGDAVPDFLLTNQSGRTISLKSFRGKVLVLTFIYTRCPLSDFCPRMSHNFAAIDKTLQPDASLYANTHLLSVSFDPPYDTPKVLKSYGEAYTGQYTQSTFAHWDFAVPPAAELLKVEQFFDVGVTPAQDKSLQHSLSTLVIGKDGKVVAFWPTNDWQIDDVLAKIKLAASQHN